MHRSLPFYALLCLGFGVAAYAEIPCGTCHQDRTEHAHDKVAECTDCHGENPEHPRDSTGMVTFTTEPAAVRAAACSACHDQQHDKPGTSPHARAGLACNDCHPNHSKREGIPASLGADASGSSVCYDCHQNIFAQFEFNERHRLQENILTCTSCHDPHEAVSRTNLGAFSDIGCRNCHADKDGPFVFEHAASKIEGCVACHTPHGSPNRHLLKHQDTGELCLGCHAIVPQFHLGFAPTGPSRFGTDTVCTNCHVAIHGSNFDRLFLK